MSNDKRQHPRIPSSLETIYFTELSTSQGDERMYYPGTLIDKSHGGIGLRVNYRHNINEKIWLEGLGAPEKPLPGRVCWVSSNGNNADEYRIGVEFIQETEAPL